MTSDTGGFALPLSLLLVDDHPAVRQGLVQFAAAQGMDVCGQAGCLADALARAGERRPDVAVVDLALRGEDGLALVVELKTRSVPALVYSMHDDARHVEGAFAAGALGYVTKAEFGSVLADAIRAVAAGRRFVSPMAAVALAEAVTRRRADEGLARLSAQEREVYRLIGRGEGTYEIASAMDISTHTVESYYARIQQKLGVEGMYRLRRHAIERLRDRAG